MKIVVMKSHVKNLFVLALLLTLISNQALAQITEDFFFKSTQEYIPDPSETGDALKAPTKAGFVRNVFQGLSMENGKTLMEDENFDPLRESHGREWSAGYYGSFNTHIEGMHSDAIKEFMNESGKGIVALYKYAQLQTEPSIATGSSLAQDLVFNVQRQVLDSDRTFREQLEANPEFKHVTLATYNGCLKKQFADNKKYIEAISICQNDSIEPGGSGFAQITGETLRVDLYHPDRLNQERHVTHTDLPKDMQFDTTLSVIDSLLNQAAKGTKIALSASDFAENFKKWFGDYLIEIKEGGDQELKITEARIKPEKTAGQLINELADDRFNALMRLLKAACEASRAAPAPTTGQKFAEAATAANFWTNGALTSSKEDLMAVSIPELPMTSIIGDSFMNFVAYRDASKVVADCSVWNKTAGSPGFTAPGAGGTPVAKTDVLLPIYNLYYIFAHHIATHQLLWSFQKAHELTGKLAGLGDVNNPLRDKAFSLIKDPFGTLDFEQLKRQNLNNLLASIDKRVFQEQLQLVGSSGSRMTDSANLASSAGAGN